MAFVDDYGMPVFRPESLQQPRGADALDRGEEVIEGSTIGQVLALTQWDKIELMRLMKLQIDAAIKSDRLKPNDAMKILADYERGLQGYTYLSLD